MPKIHSKILSWYKSQHLIWVGPKGNTFPKFLCFGIHDEILMSRLVAYQTLCYEANLKPSVRNPRELQRSGAKIFFEKLVWLKIIFENSGGIWSKLKVEKTYQFLLVPKENVEYSISYFGQKQLLLKESFWFLASSILWRVFTCYHSVEIFPIA